MLVASVVEHHAVALAPRAVDVGGLELLLERLAERAPYREAGAGCNNTGAHAQRREAEQENSKPPHARDVGIREERGGDVEDGAKVVEPHRAHGGEVAPILFALEQLGVLGLGGGARLAEAEDPRASRFVLDDRSDELAIALFFGLLHVQRQHRRRHVLTVVQHICAERARGPRRQ